VQREQYGAWMPDGLQNNNTIVIWTGYIRLARPGTYYLTIASDGATAVYLNQARVALKGYPSGGSIHSDAFRYPETDAGEPIQPQRWQYLLPITIDSARDFPLEVRYRPHHNRPVGIDLYWITPDSPRDDEGNPIAEIVPPEVLFVDPPGETEADR
jgi:hypothetical protein